MKLDREHPLTLSWRRDGRRLAIGSEGEAALSIWDTENVRRLVRLTGHATYLTAIAYSPDGLRIASGGADGIIKLWDAETGAELLALSAHKGGVEALRFHPDGRLLASGGGTDGLVRLWDTAPVAAPSLRIVDQGDVDLSDRDFPSDPFAR